MRGSPVGRRWRRQALTGVVVAAALALAPAVPAFASETADSSSTKSDSAKSDSAKSDSADKSDGSDRPVSKAEQEKNERKVREEAAAEQRARDAAAEARADAQAAAEARAASRIGAASQQARAAWEAHDRPDRLIVVKQRTIDLVAKGRLVRRVPQGRSALNVSTLDRVAPADWLSVTDGVADLNAAVVLTRGMSLTIGGDVKEVRLVGGTSPEGAASIYTGSGRLVLRDVRIGSWDPQAGRPLPAGPGRPFIVASAGRLDATDSTISDLGTAPSDPAPRPGVSLGLGGTGSLVRTSLLRNSTGLKLDRTVGVRLEGVTIKDSADDGLVLRGDRDTTLVGITSDGNAGNGVTVTGPSSERWVTAISAARNKLFGVALLGQNKTELTNLSTSRNAIGGVRVSWSTDIRLSDLRSVDDPIGVYTHVGSGGVVLERLAISGARRGLQFEKTTRGLLASQSTIEQSSIAGVSISGHEIELRDVTINGSPTAVRVERGAGDVLADRLTLVGGDDGVVALPATSNVVLRNLSATDVGHSALRTMSPGLELAGARIDGGSTGIDVGAAARISDVTVVAVEEGIRARSPQPVVVNGAVVAAGSVGINVAPGSPTTLTASRIDALESIRGEVQQQGENTLSLPPLNLIGAIGIPLVVVALLLEQVQAFRQRSVGYGRRLTPPVVATVTTGDSLIG
jgi:hypothetical protein